MEGKMKVEMDKFNGRDIENEIRKLIESIELMDNDSKEMLYEILRETSSIITHVEISIKDIFHSLDNDFSVDNKDYMLEEYAIDDLFEQLLIVNQTILSIWGTLFSFLKRLKNCDSLKAIIELWNEWLMYYILNYNNFILLVSQNLSSNTKIVYDSGKYIFELNDDFHTKIAEPIYEMILRMPLVKPLFWK